MYSLPSAMATCAPGRVAISVAALAHIPSMRMLISSNPALARMLRMATLSVQTPPGLLIRSSSFLAPAFSTSLMALSKSAALLSSSLHFHHFGPSSTISPYSITSAVSLFSASMWTLYASLKISLGITPRPPLSPRRRPAGRRRSPARLRPFPPFRRFPSCAAARWPICRCRCIP